MDLPGSDESRLVGACWLRGPGVPPLPGLRASSLPPAPGYESDEEGGLCGATKQQSLLPDAFNILALSFSNMHGETARRDRSGNGSILQQPAVAFLSRCHGRTNDFVPRVRAGTVARPRNTIDESPPPRRPISIPIKGGAHVALENAAGINDSGDARVLRILDIPTDSRRTRYSASVAVVIITEPRTWEKHARARAGKLLVAGVRGIRDGGPWASTFGPDRSTR